MTQWGREETIDNSGTRQNPSSRVIAGRASAFSRSVGGAGPSKKAASVAKLRLFRCSCPAATSILLLRSL